MGVALGGVGFIRRRYEAFSDINLPLPGFWKWGSLSYFNAHLRGLSAVQSSLDLICKPIEVFMQAIECSPLDGIRG
jgi:hypothetical protein